jgi:hypothetical protein
VHPYLRQTVQQLVARYAPEPWCVGMYLSGSGGTGTDDEWSDVDLNLVVEDEAYGAAAEGLRTVCEQECGAIQVWLREGERPGQYCNYAFLFEKDGEQFLYDFVLISRGYLLASPQRRPPAPAAVLHDPEGLLARLHEERPPQPYAPERTGRMDQLPYAIDYYWVYAYLNGKYWRRQDVYKLLYVQQNLFSTHLRVLRALHPDGEWGWWPRDVKRLPDETRATLLRYFVPPDPEAVRAALAAELDGFGHDARAACARWEVTYPAALEVYVRRHLADAGVL